MSPTPKKPRKRKPTAKQEAPPAPVEAPDLEDLLAEARATVHAAISGLQESIAKVRRQLSEQPAGEHNSALASHLAYLSRHATQALAEIRKLDSEQRKVDANLAPTELDALVLEYLTEIPRERREELRRRLDERVGDDLLLSH